MSWQINGVAARTYGFLIADRPKFRDATQSYTRARVHGKPGAMMGARSVPEREGSLVGTVVGRTAALTEGYLDQLKLLFAAGVTLKDVSPGGNTRQIDVKQQGAFAPVAADRAGKAYRVAIPLVAPDAYWEAASTTTVTLAVAGTYYDVALGTAESLSLITLLNCTNPVVTYRNSSDVAVYALDLSYNGGVTVSGGSDNVAIDMALGRITKTVSGVTTNIIDTMTPASDFPWALRPSDGVYGGDTPNIRTNSGTGTVVYTKAYL